MAGQAVIGALRVDLGLNSAKFSKGLRQSQSKLSSFAKTAGNAMKGVAVAAAAAGAGMTLAVRGILNEADKMAKISRQIGVPIDELSRLSHAADLSGVSFENLQTGLRRLSKNMHDAANGIGIGKDAFERLGIEVKNADGTLKSSTDVMSELSDAFERMPDGAQKTALAMDLMGRSGAQMIPMLNGGAEGLQEMMSEADRLGIVLDAETGQAAERFNDNLDRLGKVFKSVSMQLAADLAPELAAFTDWLVSVTPSMRGLASSVAEGFSNIVRTAVGSYRAVEATWNNLPVYMENIGQSSGAAFANAFIDNINKVLFAMQTIPNTVRSLMGLDMEFFTLPRIPTQLTIGGNATSPQDAFLSAFKDGSLEDAFGRVRQEAEGISHEIHKAGVATGKLGGAAKAAQDPWNGLRLVTDDTMKKIQDASSNLGQSLGGIFSGLIDKTMTWKDAALQAFQAVLSYLNQMSLTNNGSGLFGGGFFGGLINSLIGIPSFAGGGYTGSGARVGGLDGQGGMLAMVHPNESIIDHTKGGISNSGSGVNVSISFEGDGIRAIAQDEAGKVTGEALTKYDKEVAPNTALSAVKKGQRYGVA